MKLSFLNNILIDIAKDKNIEIKFYSENYLIEIIKENKTKYIIGNDIGNNSSISYQIATDKFCTYIILKNNNIPVIEHSFINKDNIEELKLQKKYNYNVVIKPNTGMEGKNVVHVTNYIDLLNNAKKIINKDKSAIVCPFYEIKEEYRVVYLNGESLLIYAKQRPYVIGNSKNTVEELIKINNLKYIHLDEIDDKILNYVPKNNEKVIVSWKHNLCFGSIPKIVTDEKKFSIIKEIASKSALAIGINFATIDIVELYDDKFMIIEINSRVSISKFAEYESRGYQIAKEIFSKAVDDIFKNKE